MSKKESLAGSTPAVGKLDAVDINDVIDNPFELPLLTDYLGTAKSKDALLHACNIDTGKFGDFVTVGISDNGSDPVTYRSGGTAIVSQIGKLLASGIDLNQGVLVHITKRSSPAGDYLSLLG